MLEKASTPAKSESQKRFLDAYRETLRVASAARRAGVHRATVYRWPVDPDLAALVAAWPTLPDHIRAAVRALLGTVTVSAGTTPHLRNEHLKR